MLVKVIGMLAGYLAPCIPLAFGTALQDFWTLQNVELFLLFFIFKKSFKTDGIKGSLSIFR